MIVRKRLKVCDRAGRDREYVRMEGVHAIRSDIKGGRLMEKINGRSKAWRGYG